jgi:hypothetical protein
MGQEPATAGASAKKEILRMARLSVSQSSEDDRAGGVTP